MRKMKKFYLVGFKRPGFRIFEHEYSKTFKKKDDAQEFRNSLKEAGFISTFVKQRMAKKDFYVTY